MAASLKKGIQSVYRYIYQHLPIPHNAKHFLREKIYHGVAWFECLFSKQPPLPELASAKTNLPDIFVFSVIDWFFRTQRPQHLARELAKKGHRVFYFSNVFKLRKQSGFIAEKLDGNLPLYNIHLFCANTVSIYNHDLTQHELHQVNQALSEFLIWTGPHKTLSLVEHAFWTDLAFTLPHNHVIYDCMDYHAGFGNVDQHMIDKENKLFKSAAMIIASSQKLYDEAKRHNPQVTLIRNATEYTHFEKRPEVIYTDPQKRKIVGYYGEISDWFDLDLIESLAQQRPEVLILLIGLDRIKAQKKLRAYPNIIFTGEVSYNTLPYYLHAFDVCLIPFKLNPLTEATNPVKVFEYLSAGKPVVSVNLPELQELSHLVAVTHSADDFYQKINAYLDNPADAKARQLFASQQTWTARVNALEEALQKIYLPLESTSHHHLSQ